MHSFCLIFIFILVDKKVKVITLNTLKKNMFGRVQARKQKRYPFLNSWSRHCGQGLEHRFSGFGLDVGHGIRNLNQNQS